MQRACYEGHELDGSKTDILVSSFASREKHFFDKVFCEVGSFDACGVVFIIAVIVIVIVLFLDLFEV